MNKFVLKYINMNLLFLLYINSYFNITIMFFNNKGYYNVNFN